MCIYVVFLNRFYLQNTFPTLLNYVCIRYICAFILEIYIYIHLNRQMKREARKVIYKCVQRNDFRLYCFSLCRITDHSQAMLLFWLSKKISNDQELIQSDPTSCPQNQKGNN